MAEKKYDELFRQIAEQDDRLSRIDPELDAIYRKKGKPKNFIPEADRMTWYRAVSSGATARFMKSPFVQETLAALPDVGMEKEDRCIPADDGHQLPIRIYRTTLSYKEGRPVMLMSHGGGMCLGDLQTEDFICMLVCQSLNMVVVSVDYRLAPEVKHGRIVHDVYDALRWVSRNAQSIGGDLSKGFINAGVSGGGNLTVASTYLARRDNMRPSLTGTMYMCTGMPHNMHDSTGRSLDLWSRKLASWYTHEFAPSSNREVNLAYLRLAEADLRSRLFTPLLEEDHSNLPAVYYQVCGMDAWRDSAIFYTHLVNEAGSSTKMDIYPGVPHCWWASYPQLSQSRKWAVDTVEGVRWLLKQDYQTGSARSRL